MMTPELKQAYQHCQNIARHHYENFPVASLFLPKKSRQAISAIYAFARTADDIADEGELSQAERLQQLQHYQQQLDIMTEPYEQTSNPIFLALSHTINQFNLPRPLFDDLLSAFQQDVEQQRYTDHNEILDYCRRSAAPIGRLLLQLHGQVDLIHQSQSDAICTALQLINFYQDIEDDIKQRNRIYLPIQELIEFGIDPDAILITPSKKMAPLLRRQYQRTHQLIVHGYLLGSHLQGRLGWEIRTIILAAITTLNKLMAQADENLLSCPRLTKKTIASLALISISKRQFIRVSHSLLDLN